MSKRALGSHLLHVGLATPHRIFDWHWLAIPEISGETECSVRLFGQGDVIRAFQPDDVIAFGFVFVIAPGLGVLEQG